MVFTSLRKTNSIVFSGNALVLRVHQQARQGEGKSRIPSGIEGWAGFPLLVLFLPTFFALFHTTTFLRRELPIDARRLNLTTSSLSRILKF